MRDRLIKLINQLRIDNKVSVTDGHTQTLADYLIENGVIVPPVKVGDKVYLPCLNDWGDIENYTITEIVLDNDGLCFVVDDEDREAHSIEILGKEVFLAKEEAEKALRGVQNNEICT